MFFRRLLQLSLFLVALNTFKANGQDFEVVPNIKVGYNYVASGLETSIFEAGYYHCYDYLIFSHGPSATLMFGTNDDHNLMIGPKISYEAQFLCLAAKVDLAYLHPYVNFTPSVGLSLLGWASVYTGYNICLNQKGASGFTFSCFINVNMSSRPDFKFWGMKKKEEKFYAGRIGN